jgi:hypothetical protein
MKYVDILAVGNLDVRHWNVMGERGNVERKGVDGEIKLTECKLIVHHNVEFHPDADAG